MPPDPLGVALPGRSLLQLGYAPVLYANLAAHGIVTLSKVQGLYTG